MYALKPMQAGLRILTVEQGGEGAERRDWPSQPIACRDYVEENKEEESAYAPLKGQPRQASKHGSRLNKSFCCASF
jgi:hypothetical protein